MNIQNSNHNQTYFTGYDARKLKGFVMNSNFAGIADEIRKIGEIENFKVFLFEKNPSGILLKTDKFELSQNHAGCWAQDNFGIVKNTLLARDLTEKPKILREIFNLFQNKTQAKIQEEMNLPEIQDYVDILFNLPKGVKNGKEVVFMPTENGFLDVDKKLFDVEFNRNVKLLGEIGKQCHPKGGNYFLTKNSNGEDELLIGRNELKKFSFEQLKEMFMTDKVHIIPQCDYHLDLFIRPLKDKKVLIADDEMTAELLQKGFAKLHNFVARLPKSEMEQYRDAYVKTGCMAQAFKKIIDINPYAKPKEAEDALLKAGYEPIRVPGRLFELFSSKGDNGKPEYILKNHQNFINANVHINDKDEIVYITNKSNIGKTLGMSEKLQDLTGLNFEKIFADSIKPYVDKIYFVSGKDDAIANKLLPEYYGGIHCMTMEVPGA